MDIEISLSGPEREYVEQQIRSGRAASEGEVVRGALRSMIDRDGDERRKYEEWRERMRRELDEAYEESFTDEGLDGPAVFEELRLELEARRDQQT